MLKTYIANEEKLAIMIEIASMNEPLANTSASLHTVNNNGRNNGNKYHS